GSHGPTKIFEFDPVGSGFTDVTPPGYDLSQASFKARMLVLPSGQILLADGVSPQLFLYTPAGSPNAAWKPVVSNISNNGNGTFTLSGPQLNGISQGASYGDDAEMDSNYPIVRLADGAGNVYYARTSNWSSTGVATGSTTVTTVFTPPAGLPAVLYSLTV